MSMLCFYSQACGCENLCKAQHCATHSHGLKAKQRLPLVEACLQVVAMLHIARHERPGLAPSASIPGQPSSSTIRGCPAAETAGTVLQVKADVTSPQLFDCLTGTPDAEGSSPGLSCLAECSTATTCKHGKRYFALSVYQCVAKFQCCIFRHCKAPLP